MFKVSKVILVYKEFKETLDFKELLVCKVKRVYKGKLEFREIRVSQVYKVKLEFREHRVLLG